MEQVDRRQFMQKASLASAAAGAAWVAPSVLGSSTAFAAGSCILKGGLSWSSTTSTGSSPGPAVPSSRTAFAGTTVPSTTTAITFSTTITTPGAPTAYLVVTVTPTATHPGAGSGNNGGVDATVPYPNNPAPAGLDGTLSYYAMDMTNGGANRGYTMTFSWYSNAAHTTTLDVYNLAFTLLDIDTDSTSGNKYKDNVWLGTTGYTATKGSEVGGAGTAASPWTGNTTAGVQNANGNVAVAYPTSQGQNSLSLFYQSGNNAGGIQYIGIGDMTWCY